MYIMNTPKKSASLLAAIIFAAGIANAPAQYAVWQVNQPTDYAREPTQQANLQQLQAIRALAQQIKDLNVLIENSTRLTEQHTNKMQRDIEIMRRIGQKRQELTLALARLEALSGAAEVFKNDPWATAAATSGVTGTSLEKIFKEMGSYGPAPLDTAKLDAGVEVGDGDSRTEGTMWGESFTTDGEYGLEVYNGDNVFSTAVKPQDVIDGVKSAKESLIGRSYNGYGFVGLGAGYVENMVGVGGRLVSMDYVPPFSNIILNDQQKRALKEILSGTVTGSIRKGYRAASTGDINPFEIVPGFFVRPRTEADDLYEKMVLRGTPETEATFWSSAAVYGGSQYDPAKGFSSEGKFKAAVNMNNVLSNGAYQAIQEYNQANGITSNPYGQFAKAVAGVVGVRLEETKPGAKLVITAEDVTSGKSGARNGLSSLGGPSTPEEWTGLFDRSKKVHGDWVKAAFAEVPATAGVTGPENMPMPDTEDAEVFVGIGLSKADTKEYTSKIMANSSRLSENNKSLLVSVLTAKYNQECLEKIVALEEELKRLGDGADVESIIETIPMMRQNAQNTILVLQNRLAQLQAQVEEQLQSKHGTLTDRQSIVQEYREKITKNGRGVVERVLSLASPTGM